MATQNLRLPQACQLCACVPDMVELGDAVFLPLRIHKVSVKLEGRVAMVRRIVKTQLRPMSILNVGARPELSFLAKAMCE